MAQNASKAVITGDIIHSTKMNNQERLGLFNQLKDALRTWENSYEMKTELFRGDSFQCLIHNPGDALRIALLIKTYIRSLNPSDLYDLSKKSNTNERSRRVITNWMFDTRLSIGIGEVDHETKTLSSSNGEAFLLSGHYLDMLKDSRQHLGITSIDKYEPEWATESILLDALIRKTSALQCEVINLKLLGYTEIQIASRLGVGQSAVNQRSNNADWNAIEAMVDRFETVYSLA